MFWRAASGETLPLRVRACVFGSGVGVGDPSQPPPWLGFAKVASHGPFCGFDADGTASIRIGVRGAARRATERAIRRIDDSAYREGGVVDSRLTRAQILAVALLPGVVWIRPDGSGWPNSERVSPW